MDYVRGWVTSVRYPNREDAAWTLIFQIAILRGMDQKNMVHVLKKYGVEAPLYFSKFQTIKKYQADMIN